MVKPWRTKEWRERRKEILMNRPNCEWCGFDSYLQIAHKSGSGRSDNYHQMLEEEVVVLCRSCHFIMHKGSDPCLKCGKWKRSRYDRCYTCWNKATDDEVNQQHEETLEEFEERVDI